MPAPKASRTFRYLEIGATIAPFITLGIIIHSAHRAITLSELIEIEQRMVTQFEEGTKTMQEIINEMIDRVELVRAASDSPELIEQLEKHIKRTKTLENRLLEQQKE